MLSVFSTSKIKMTLEHKGKRWLKCLTKFILLPKVCSFLTGAGRSRYFGEAGGSIHQGGLGLELKALSVDSHIGYHIPTGLREHRVTVIS